MQGCEAWPEVREVEARPAESQATHRRVRNLYLYVPYVPVLLSYRQFKPMATEGLPELLASLRGGSCHAAVTVRDMCRQLVSIPPLLQAGAVPALIDVASHTTNVKLRGWVLSALAFLARSEDESAHAALPDALPTLIIALYSSPPECEAWAADAIACICRTSRTSAQAVQLGAVPPLLGLVISPHPNRASEAVACASLRALSALMRVGAARAQLVCTERLAGLIALLRKAALAPLASELLCELCAHGGAAAARRFLCCPALSPALPLVLTCESGMHNLIRTAAAQFIQGAVELIGRKAARPTCGAAESSSPSPHDVRASLSHAEVEALQSLRAAARQLANNPSASASREGSALPTKCTLDALTQALSSLLAAQDESIESPRAGEAATGQAGKPSESARRGRREEAAKLSLPPRRAESRRPFEDLSNKENDRASSSAGVKAKRLAGAAEVSV